MNGRGADLRDGWTALDGSGSYTATLTRPEPTSRTSAAGPGPWTIALVTISEVSSSAVSMTSRDQPTSASRTCRRAVAGLPAMGK